MELINFMSILYNEEKKKGKRENGRVTEEHDTNISIKLIKKNKHDDILESLADN